MNRIKNLLGVFAFSLLVLSLPTIASAQWGGNNRNGGYGNGGYGNNGYYNGNLKNTVKRLKNDSRDFSKFVDREFGRNNGGYWGRGNNLSQLANDFKRAADRLENRFDNRDLYKSQYEAQEVINLANQISRTMNRSRSSYDLQGYWNNIENQVDEIANAYRYNNGRGNGRGNNRNNGGWGDWRNKLPF